MTLSADARSTLVALAHMLALRSLIVLACAEGRTNTDVGAELRVHPTTVAKWRHLFAPERLDGLVDGSTPRCSGPSDAPLSSSAREVFFSPSRFVSPHASDDVVGEVPFVGSAGLTAGLAGDVGPCVVVVALLGDRGDVEHAVDRAVAAETEPVFDRQTDALTGRERDCAGAGPSGELRLGGESERITDLDQPGRRGDREPPTSAGEARRP